MLYGSQRLVSLRESPNVQRAFDGIRLLSQFGTWKLDAFFTLPVEVDRGFFDDGPIRAQLFWGAYAVGPFPKVPPLNMDLYYLGFRNTKAAFDFGKGLETRHSLGTRLWGKWKGWDYNWEFGYQTGSFLGQPIQAWSASADNGYVWENVWGKPGMGLKADAVSGNGGGEGFNTFNPFFPNGNYFGVSFL